MRKRKKGYKPEHALLFRPVTGPIDFISEAKNPPPPRGHRAGVLLKILSKRANQSDFLTPERIRWSLVSSVVPLQQARRSTCISRSHVLYYYTLTHTRAHWRPLSASHPAQSGRRIVTVDLDQPRPPELVVVEVMMVLAGRANRIRIKSAATEV